MVSLPASVLALKFLFRNRTGSYIVREWFACSPLLLVTVSAFSTSSMIAVIYSHSIIIIWSSVEAEVVTRHSTHVG